MTNVSVSESRRYLHVDGVDLQRRSLFLLRSTAHKLTELRRALRRNGGGGAFRWPPRTNRASRAPGTPAPASSRASAPVFLELIECALPAHAPQDGRPHLMLSHLSSYFSVSGGLLKLAAGPARRPGLIYCRSCLADETEMSRCSLAKHSVLRRLTRPTTAAQLRGKVAERLDGVYTHL